MLDIGWQELAIIFVIALIVVGPRDLPKIIRTVGEWMGKVRGYARDFQRTIDEAADYTEINAIKKEIEEANKELSAAKRDVETQADDMNRMMSEEAGSAESKPDTTKANGEAPESATVALSPKDVPAKPSSSPAGNDIKPPAATSNGAGEGSAPTNPQTSS